MATKLLVLLPLWILLHLHLLLALLKVHLLVLVMWPLLLILAALVIVVVHSLLVSRHSLILAALHLVSIVFTHDRPLARVVRSIALAVGKGFSLLLVGFTLVFIVRVEVVVVVLHLVLAWGVVA